MIKRLKDTWGIWNQFNRSGRHIITIKDRDGIYGALYGATKEDWFTLLRWYGRFTKVVSIETITDRLFTDLVITIDKPDLVWTGRRKRCYGKKAKKKYWDSVYNKFL